MPRSPAWEAMCSSFSTTRRSEPSTDGERAWPTQPIPTAPPPLVSHAPVRPDDAWGLILWDKWRCRKLIGRHRSEGIYTPPSTEGTILTPGYAGGVNWGSLAFEPSRQLAVVNAMQVPTVVTLIPRADYRGGDPAFAGSEFAEQKGTPYGMRRGSVPSFR